MMGIVDIEETQNGPVYLWNWARQHHDEKMYVNLANDVSVDCHDINIAVGEADFYASYDGKGFAKFSLEVGACVHSVKIRGAL